MKIGILGSGIVGQTLGAGFAAVGHDVLMGTRKPGAEKIVAWTSRAGARASAGTFEDAARFGEVVLLATLWSGTKNALDLAGIHNFDGKVVIDATNPLVFHEGGPPTLALGHTDSGGEQVQRWLPAARVVKAFNTIGNAHMVNPDFPDGSPDLFVCGDDADAKEQVSALSRQLGWPPAIDLGGLEHARLLEPLCILWVVHGLNTGSWNHALKMLHK